MKSVMIKLMSLSIMFTLLSSWEAASQHLGNRSKTSTLPKWEKIFNKFDKDGDGLLSIKEVKGSTNKHFYRIDINKDYFISMEEFEKFLIPKKDLVCNKRNCKI
ncbi:hypothetical protein [Aquimarina sp. AU119]|uniref:hypothetical protein n=1 Tax=Aquimarina sp. AU119 TaxID=2108528 RepID=UPI000D696A3A|nr:hypothetical protein [Aquimarina sp. AU119]